MKKAIGPTPSVNPEERRRRAVELTARLVVAEHLRRQHSMPKTEEANLAIMASPTRRPPDGSVKGSDTHDVPTGA
jgi:hypothetical protein